MARKTAINKPFRYTIVDQLMQLAGTDADKELHSLLNELAANGFHRVTTRRKIVSKALSKVSKMSEHRRLLGHTELEICKNFINQLAHRRGKYKQLKIKDLKELYTNGQFVVLSSVAQDKRIPQTLFSLNN